jgi:glycosyltransferase involved in cell wall biosynthesis
MDLAAALSRTTANVIHVGPLPYNQLMYYGLRAARRRGARILCTPCTHFGEEASHEVARHYTQPFQTQLLNHCDTVLALTELERKRLVELGVSPDRVVTTGAGIDVENAVGGAAEACRRELGLGDSPIVLHFGMKAFEKGSVSVVEAMKILWANGSQARLVMAGPGMQAVKDYLQAQTGNLGRFLDLPPVNDRQKRDLMAAATVFVQPSRVESFGLIYVEAWANAKPLIAADTGVSRELIEDGVDGLLVPFGNAARIADAINCLLESSDLRQRMAEAGRRKVLARYTWEAAIARIRPYFSANAPGSASQD